MMPRNIFFILFPTILFLQACVITPKGERSIKFSSQAGINHGGITENRILDDITGATVDAFSGATRIGVNAGIHANKPLKYGELETGVDYMYNKQIYTYADAVNDFQGKRSLFVNHVMIPLTYNFIPFKKSIPAIDLQIKLGYQFLWNIISVDDTGKLPEFELNKTSGGLILGVAAYPFSFDNGSRLGFYVDLYKGSRIYTDFYNGKGIETPGSSHIKGGIRYRFN